MAYGNRLGRVGSKRAQNGPEFARQKSRAKKRPRDGALRLCDGIAWWGALVYQVTVQVIFRNRHVVTAGLDLV